MSKKKQKKYDGDKEWDNAPPESEDIISPYNFAGHHPGWFFVPILIFILIIIFLFFLGIRMASNQGHRERMALIKNGYIQKAVPYQLPNKTTTTTILIWVKEKKREQNE